MPKFRILSFDGGGIRGALSTRLLLRIVQQYPDLISHIDLFAGTSTGSIIALALAYGISPQKIDDLYTEDLMKYIFTPSRKNVSRPKYDNIHMKSLLSQVFPANLTLNKLPYSVFVPSFNVKGYNCSSFNTVFFNNLTDNPTSYETVIDVALSSSAAPTYFPSCNNFIDGGVSTNSPTCASLLYTHGLFPNTYDFSDFRLLSIGTGFYPISITDNTEDWGILQWAYNPSSKVDLPLLSILMSTSQPLDNFYAKEILGSNFFRLNPLLEKPIALDNYKEVPYLKQLADEINLDPIINFIEDYFLR